ncbi:hypothetical protein T3H00_15315 [Pseudomonas fluorescens]|jgi:hypothetical protein|uniref:hypothetical protein n=1 Tax=Pseudomonas TaxID=286 RepID=UPI001A924898|nr:MULTISPECIES: hypothetical protein [Pseudomonas]MDZ5434028.1 hypothetical protein [Pseudomonas fluorescens]
MPRERTHLRYQLYKSQARKLAGIAIAQLQDELERACPTTLDLSKVRFEPIDTQALDASERWDDPHFSWREIVGWKAKEPLALDLSIWFDEQLCGLCFANPNNSRQRIRIVRLEGRPGEVHPLKKRIATLSILVIEHYAAIIGSRFIEVQEPLKGAIPIYQQHGFYFDAERRLVKALESLVS